MSAFGPKLPLKLGSQQGYNMISDLKSLVRQNFLMLLLTNPGERIMDSNFGVGLKRILFENYSSTLIINFESRLRTQIARYAPYIELTNISYGSLNQEGNLLSVNIGIFITPLGTSENITIQSDGQLIIS
jgi:hypothetical protein